MWKSMVSIFTHLKWAFNFLLCYSFSVLLPYPCYNNVPKTCGEELSITRYHDHGENLECAVCLSSIEEGQEIGELRCSHVFHKGCLDRWVFGFNRTTCPLCRGSLAPPLAQPEFGVEVILIKLWSFRSVDEDRDTWWLR